MLLFPCIGNSHSQPLPPILCGALCSPASCPCHWPLLPPNPTLSPLPVCPIMNAFLSPLILGVFWGCMWELSSQPLEHLALESPTHTPHAGVRVRCSPVGWQLLRLGCAPACVMGHVPLGTGLLMRSPETFPAEAELGGSFSEWGAVLHGAPAVSLVVAQQQPWSAGQASDQAVTEHQGGRWLARPRRTRLGTGPTALKKSAARRVFLVV